MLNFQDGSEMDESGEEEESGSSVGDEEGSGSETDGKPGFLLVLKIINMIM